MEHSGPAAEKRTHSPRDEHFVLMTAGGHHLAIPVADIQEVVHFAELATPPSLPAFVKGFLSLDGALIAVIDLARLFTLPPQRVSAYSPVVILRHAVHPLAILVESVHAVATAAPDAISPVPPDHTFGDCAVGSGDWSSQLHCVLDVQRLLMKEETQRIAALTDAARERLAQLAEVS